MKLRKLILLALRGSIDIKKEIAEKNYKTLTTVNNWIDNNDDNLTKISNLRIIRDGFAKEGLDLTDDQILEPETSNVGQN